MRILHVYKDYFPVLGGIENHIRVLAEAQAARGHAVTVLATNPGRASVQTALEGVRVIKARRLATVASTPISPALAMALRREQPDITHVHSPYPVGELAQWLAGRGRPYVVTYHADTTRPVQRAIMRLYAPLLHRVLRGARRVMATSPNYAASSPHLRAVPDRIAIVPLGVDARRFAPAGREPGAAPASPAESRGLALLFVGLLRHYKGVDDLLRALARLEPPARAQVRLRVAGAGPRRGEWEALSHSLGLAEQVTFLGRVPDDELPREYRAADVFVLPANSRAEAFGAVLLEAMAAELPCITTDIGSGTTYVVQHKVTGLVVPARDPTALAGAIGCLLADAALRRQMGRAGRQRVLDEFTQAQMIERVEAVYRAALEPRTLG